MSFHYFHVLYFHPLLLPLRGKMLDGEERNVQHWHWHSFLHLIHSGAHSVFIDFLHVITWSQVLRICQLNGVIIWRKIVSGRNKQCIVLSTYIWSSVPELRRHSVPDPRRWCLQAPVLNLCLQPQENVARSGKWFAFKILSEINSNHQQRCISNG